MKQSVSWQSVWQPASSRANYDRRPGPKGIAARPPAYGISAVDRLAGPAGVVVQNQTAAETSASPSPSRERDPAPGVEDRERTEPGSKALPHLLRQGIESLSGMDMSAVRVHRDSHRPAQLNALAFAQGNDIHLGPGQARHLPHEAWHVVQQRQGRVPVTRQLRGVGVNDDAGLEREADRMGNQAVQSTERARQGVQRRLSPSAPAPRAAPVQRLIGFEIESRIPVWFEDGPDIYSKADYDTINADVGLGDRSKLTVDKEGEDSIIEFVSGPVSDTQKKSDFRNMARDWVNILTDLRADAVNTPPLADLHAKFNTAPANARFGFQGADTTGQVDKVAIQVTHGLRLSYVEKYMSKMTYDDISAGRDRQKVEALHETKAVVETVMDQITELYDPDAVITKRSVRSKKLADVRGLIALMVHYLLLGGKGISAYLKNQLSLFYKSKLSEVRDNLVGPLLTPNNAYAAHLFRDGARRDRVRQSLRTATNRASDEPLFPRATVTVDAWIRAVLEGTGDPFFEEAKNPWGTDILPGLVKGKLAVVVEHRDLFKDQAPAEELKLSQPNEIVDYMVAVFRANQSKQDL